MISKNRDVGRQRGPCIRKLLPRRELGWWSGCFRDALLGAQNLSLLRAVHTD